MPICNQLSLLNCCQFLSIIKFIPIHLAEVLSLVFDYLALEIDVKLMVSVLKCLSSIHYQYSPHVITMGTEIFT